jgi:riboflavin synthase
MQAGARLGGHIVQGHVDGVAKLLSLAPVKKNANGESDYWLRICVPPDLSRYVVEKGSITVEGISLTIAGMSGNEITIAIVPHTLAMTNLRHKKRGDPLNLEVDVLAKYAERQGNRIGGPPLTINRLRREGF